MSYNSTQGRSNHCCALKPLIVLEAGSHSTCQHCQHCWSWGKASQPQEILGADFLVGTALCKLLLWKFCIETYFCCFFQVSLVYLCTESFCGEDFTAAFYPLHKGKRLLSGRRNGNKSSERQRRGDSWALTCADTQVSALSFICSLSGLCQRFTSLPSPVISEGNSLSPWHRKTNVGKQAGWAPLHHLYMHIQIGSVWKSLPSSPHTPGLPGWGFLVWHVTATPNMITRSQNHIAQPSPHCTSSTFTPQSIPATSHLNIKPFTNSLLFFPLSHFPHLWSHWMPQTELTVLSLPLVRHEKG